MKAAMMIEQQAKEINVESQGPLSSHVRTVIKNDIIRHAAYIKNLVSKEFEI